MPSLSTLSQYRCPLSVPTHRPHTPSQYREHGVGTAAYAISVPRAPLFEWLHTLSPYTTKDDNHSGLAPTATSVPGIAEGARRQMEHRVPCVLASRCWSTWPTDHATRCQYYSRPRIRLLAPVVGTRDVGIQVCMAYVHACQCGMAGWLIREGGTAH
eukprot:1892593-Rhodomonas_salina.1